MKASKALCLLFAACAAIATASPAAASDREYDGFTVNECTSPAPDVAVPPTPGSGDNAGAFPHFCRVDMLRTPLWQASTNEWVLFRVGDAGTLPQCQASTADISVSYTLDGQPVDSYVAPCQLRPDGSWLVDFRFLSSPLPAGVHTVTATATSTSHFNFVLSQDITVMPMG